MTARRQDKIIYAGGDLPRSIGDEVSSRISLFPILGANEIEFIPTIYPTCGLSEDWHSLRIHPHIPIEFRPQSEGFYQLIFHRQAGSEHLQPQFTISPDQNEYTTGDLFVPHSTKPDLWNYGGRSDDIIVFLNGEKHNPVTTEEMVSCHHEIRSVLVVGSHRSEAAFLVELG